MWDIYVCWLVGDGVEEGVGDVVFVLRVFCVYKYVVLYVVVLVLVYFLCLCIVFILWHGCCGSVCFCVLWWLLCSVGVFVYVCVFVVCVASVRRVYTVVLWAWVCFVFGF